MSCIHLACSVHCCSSLLSNNLLLYTVHIHYCILYIYTYVISRHTKFLTSIWKFGNNYGNLITYGRFHHFALNVIYPYNRVNQHSCFNRNKFLLIYKLPSHYMQCNIYILYFDCNKHLISISS